MTLPSLGNDYRVIRPLGRGGTGEVFLAEKVATGELQAVKVLRATLTQDAELMARFRREAKVLERLRHPAIVGLVGSGQLDDGRYYLAMEYVDGPSLSKAIAGRPLGVERSIAIAITLAEAIDHAHRRDVVHRDLSPSNVLLTDIASPRILDFGFAKIIEPGHDDSVDSTRRGSVLGSPNTMAPEQISGNSREPRIDLYALGCILYEMLTGQPVYTGRPMELLRAHVSDIPVPPTVRAPNAGIPSRLNPVVMRCLEKDPQARFATGIELADALARARGPKTLMSPREPDTLAPEPTLDEPLDTAATRRAPLYDDDE